MVRVENSAIRGRRKSRLSINTLKTWRFGSHCKAKIYVVSVRKNTDWVSVKCLNKPWSRERKDWFFSQRRKSEVSYVLKSTNHIPEIALKENIHSWEANPFKKAFTQHVDYMQQLTKKNPNEDTFKRWQQKKMTSRTIKAPFRGQYSPTKPIKRIKVGRKEKTPSCFKHHTLPISI